MDQGSRTTDMPPLGGSCVEGNVIPESRSHHRVKKLDDAYFGFGDHADVYIGHLNEGKVVAIKQLRGVNSNKTDIRDGLRSGLREQFDTQWRHLNHPNVCSVHLIVDDFGFLPALVLDHFPKGSLINFIEKNHPSHEQRSQWVVDVAEGLAYLHLVQVYHGDLRGANVFLNTNNQAVIADYGIVQYFNRPDFTSIKPLGRVRWTGPEAMSLPPERNVRQDKLDIFAFGMTMLEIFSGQPPFSGKSNKDAMLAIVGNESPRLPERMSSSENVRSLFEKCTRKDPSIRPLAQDVANTLKAASLFPH